MPRRRWKLKDRREPLSPATRAYLELGLGGVMAAHQAGRLEGYEDAVYFSGRHGLPPAWREHGEEIAAAWVVEHAGQRVWGWWAYDAMAPRACLEGAAYLYRGPTLTAGDWIWKQNFGIPGCPQARKPGAQPARMVFESEAVYLRRLGLLLPSEAEQLTAEDFEPEVVGVPEMLELEQVARRPTATTQRDRAAARIQEERYGPLG